MYSPNVNAMMMEQQGGDALSQEFSSSFSSMAFDTFSQQLPELLDSVVTFKILDTDPDKDFGVGTFVIVYQGTPLYVPVIMQKSELKPLELLYYKEADMFLPLSEDWVKQIISTKQIQYGDAVPRNQDIPTDVNLEELITPPRTGRYVYASEKDDDVTRMFSAGEIRAFEKMASLRQDVKLTFDTIREKLSAEDFNSLSDTMRKDIKILNKFASEGKEHLLEKKAVATHEKGKIEFIDLDTPAEVINEKYANEKSRYMTNIVEDGFQVIDNRDKESIGMNPIQVETQLKNTQVNGQGFYQMFGKSGKVYHGFYFTKPVRLLGGHRGLEPHPEHGYNGTNPRTVTPKDGIYLTKEKEAFKMYNNHKPTPAIGWINDDPNYKEDLLKTMFSGLKQRPSVGDFGVFVNMGTEPYTVTEPVFVKQIVDTDGVARIAVNRYKPLAPRKDGMGYGDLDDCNRRDSYMEKDPDQVWLSELKTSIQKYDKSGITALNQKEWRWLPLKERDFGSMGDESNFVTSPKFLEDFIRTQALERGGKANKVIRDDIGEFSLNGDKPMTKRAAVEKIAYDLSIPANDALQIVKQAEKSKKSEFYLFEKNASIFASEAPVQAEQPAMDPMQEQMMMQEQMGQMGAPEISPQFMGAAQQLDNEGVFNVSTLMSLNKRQVVRNIFKDYFPTFKDTLDALGRVLYTLWVKEPDLVQELSLEGYQEIEDNVRLLFKGLGDLVLSTSKDSEILTL